MASNFYDPSKGFEQNSDVSVEAQALARRQKLLDSMQQRVMSPEIRGTGAQGLVQLLSNLGSAWLLKGAQEDQAAQMKANETARLASLQQNLGAFFDKSQGRPGETLSTQQAGDLLLNDIAPPQLAEPVKANPREAVLQAMASQHPELQAIGKMSMAELMKQGTKPGFKDHIVDGKIVRSYDDGRTPETLGDFKDREKWSAPYLMKGADGRDIMVVTNLLTNKPELVDKAPKINVTATANADAGHKGAVAASEALGKKVPDVLSEARQTVIEGQKAIQDAQQLYQLASSPNLITGFGAGPRAGLASLSTALGFTGPEAASQTQAALSAMANQTLNQVRRLPGAITEKERPFLEKAAAGQLEYTPETLRHLAGLAMATSHNAVLEAFKQYGGAISIPGADVGAQMYPLPEVSYSMDPNLFTDIGNSRMRYKGALPGMPAPASGGGGDNTPARSGNQTGPRVKNW